MTEKQQKAIELHQKGYNCFQAVADRKSVV